MLRVWVHAAPTDGQANEAVCRAIADALDKPSSAVTVATGLKSRTKTIEVSELTDEEIRTKLA